MMTTRDKPPAPVTAEPANPFLADLCSSQSVFLLVLVELFGYTAKGATRWLNLGFTKFQPSEIMKLAVPMAIAWFISSHNLPPKKRHLTIGFLMCMIPTLLIAKQPDLGTSILIAGAGIFVLFLAGMSWKLIMLQEKML